VFLQNSSQLIETIIEEERIANHDVSKNSSKGQTLFSDDEWVTLGVSDLAIGENELICNRNVSALKFSNIQSYLLMAAYPYPLNDNDDLRQLRGLYAIWDTSASPPSAPSHILEASGQPTAVCFSDSQSYIVIAGTDEGSLHLWDLREKNSEHCDSDSIDLEIKRGIRKPCYSANLLMSAGKDIDPDQHQAKIVQIEALGAGENSMVVRTMSQFATLDKAGTLILWITRDVNDGDDTTDYGLSPWGSVILSRTRVLKLRNLPYPSQPFSSSTSMDSNESVLSLAFSTVPGDFSTIFAGVSQGALQKMVRFGEPSAPAFFQRNSPSVSDKGASYDSSITCVSVRSRYDDGSKHKSAAPLILVGRTDGSIDLFQADISTVLMTWNLNSLKIDNTSTTDDVDSSITLVRWCPSRASVFITADSLGRWFVFDLLTNPFLPVSSSSSFNGVINRCIDISFSKHTGRVALLIAERKRVLIKVRKLSKDIFKTTSSSSSTLSKEEDALTSSMLSWVGKLSSSSSSRSDNNNDDDYHK